MPTIYLVLLIAFLALIAFLLYSAGILRLKRRSKMSSSNTGSPLAGTTTVTRKADLPAVDFYQTAKRDK